MVKLNQQIDMAGHSKWAKLKHGKEARDRQKGNIFGKFSRAITMAVISGGGADDPEKNSALRFAIDRARQANIPKENIERAIARASGPDRENLREVTYEAFGPGGAAFLIRATTDNPNRTHGEVSIVLHKHEAKLAGQGAASYMFADGQPTYPVNVNSQQLGEVESIIEDLENLDDVDSVVTNASM